VSLVYEQTKTLFAYFAVHIRSALRHILLRMSEALSGLYVDTIQRSMTERTVGVLAGGKD
jgi:hypothetical protein